MARTRTTKKLAQRIDLNYFKRATPLKRAKLWLSVALPAIAVAWIAAYALRGDSRVYSSGSLSAAHAVLERQCGACHVQTAGVFSAKASDAACLSCHDGPMHHPVPTENLIWSQQKTPPGCTACHTEHRGRANLRAANDQTCTRCHSDLKSASLTATFANQITSFRDGHPEFAVVRDPKELPHIMRIRLNHAVHMKPIHRGPTGPTVQLECGNCHRPRAAQADLTYSDARYRAATVSYERNNLPPFYAEALRPARPDTGREVMAPVKFANACAGCHALTFDKRFDLGVPHDEPQVVHAFLIAKFSEYIRAHPAELREGSAERDLAGRPANARVLTTNQWIAERVYDAEQLLWRKTCAQCHGLSYRVEVGDEIPSVPPFLTVGPSRILTEPFFPMILPSLRPGRQMPHATFSHDAHQGFSCLSCHEKALSSTEMSDVLLPGIATCRTCHGPGPEHAASGCSECHTYHDWSKRKDVKPTFTLPALRSSGR